MIENPGLFRGGEVTKNVLTGAYAVGVKRLLAAGTVGAILLGITVHVAVPRQAGAYQSSCWASLLTDPEMVHTEWDRPDVLGAELRGYTAVHWQVTRPDSGLRHIPTPDRCEYQLILNMEPAHARRLAADIAAARAQHRQRFASARTRLLLARRAAAEARSPGKSLPWHPRPYIWPGLRQYATVEGRWESWGGCCPEGGRRARSLHVHADSAVAVVTYSND